MPGSGLAPARAHETPIYYVDIANSSPVFPYTNWATAANNIQDAVNASSTPGRLVLVASGLYQTGASEATTEWGQAGPNRIVLKNVVLRSVNGPEVTIIDGTGTARCAYLKANAILSGFTLRNGRATQCNGGGVFSEDSCVMTNCLLSANWSDCSGGGVMGGTLYNCVLIGNSAWDNGGGAWGGRLYHCTLTRNSAIGGGGAYNSTLNSCIVYHNLAFAHGPNWLDSSLEYSCTTPQPPGVGNISADPRFVSATHLLFDSPCLGIGDPAQSLGADIDGEPWAYPPAAGVDQVWPHQSTGALSMRMDPVIHEVGVDFPITLLAHHSGAILNSVWDFGDGTVVTNQGFMTHAWSTPGSYAIQLTGYNATHPEGVTTTCRIDVVRAVHYVNVANLTPALPYTSWATAATNLQDAVDAGTTLGRLILVADGVYQTGSTDAAKLRADQVYAEGPYRVALTNAVLQSVNGPEVTVIDGTKAARCAYLGANAILSGFTLRNGRGQGSGGAVFSEDSATVKNCVISANQCERSGGATIGGTLYNCVLINNLAPDQAGGAYRAMLYHCTVTGNSAGWAGGVNGAGLCNCIVTSNHPDNYTSGVTCEYSCTTPLLPGPGNLAVDPEFMNPATGDMRLRLGSPCIDAGRNLAALVPIDIRGVPRPLDGDGDGLALADMGAYEEGMVLLPVLMRHPSNQQACVGVDIEFVVHALGELPLAYQWQLDGSSLTDDVRILGSDTSTLRIADVREDDAGAYSVIVSNIHGSVTSNPATVKVLLRPPEITTKPAKQTLVSGGHATFTVAASGSLPMTFQWQRNGAEINDAGRISGAQTATLSIADVGIEDLGVYTVTISNAYGSVTSAPVTLTVTLQPPDITFDPVDQSVFSGSDVSFSVTAVGSLPLSYQWRCNGVALVEEGRIIGSQTATLSIAAAEVQDLGLYVVEARNAYGWTVSDPAQLTVVLAPPTITLEPQGQTVALGSTVSLHVEATGSLPLNYQWRREGADVVDGGRFSGATTSTLTIAELSLGDLGNYSVVVQNTLGRVHSESAAVATSSVVLQIRREGDQVVISWNEAVRGMRLQKASRLEDPDWQSLAGSESVVSMTLPLPQEGLGLFRLWREQ